MNSTIYIILDYFLPTNDNNTNIQDTIRIDMYRKNINKLSKCLYLSKNIYKYLNKYYIKNINKYTFLKYLNNCGIWCLMIKIYTI